MEICEHIVLGWENSSCSDPDELNTHRVTVPLTAAQENHLELEGTEQLRTFSTSPPRHLQDLWMCHRDIIQKPHCRRLIEMLSPAGTRRLKSVPSFFFVSFYKKNKAAVIKHSNFLFQTSRRIFRLQRWNYLRLQHLINCRCIEMKLWTDIRGPQRMNPTDFPFGSSRFTFFSF